MAREENEHNGNLPAVAKKLWPASTSATPPTPDNSSLHRELSEPI